MKRLILLFSLLEIARCVCLKGLELVEAGECRGFMSRVNVRQDLGINSAIQQCNAIGASPIMIKTYDQDEYWYNQVVEVGKSNPGNVDATLIVLGLVCNTETDRWQWVDGSPLSYSIARDHGINADTANCVGLPVTWYWYYDNKNAYWAGDIVLLDKNVDIYCIQQLSEPVPPPNVCENFNEDTDDGTCYQVHTNAESWQDAQKTCKSFGADLASIHNAGENSFLRRLATSKEAVYGVYLGGTHSGDDSFGWIDGSKWDYDNYYPGFPVHGAGDCLAMDTSTTQGKWMNVDCSTIMAAACAISDPTLVCPTGPWKEGQVITSPGYPYEASLPCDYFLSVDAGKRVELQIQVLEANSCCDRLIVMDSILGGNIVANVTGAIENVVYTTKSSNTMRVYWQPDGGVNVRGLMFTFRAV